MRYSKEFIELDKTIHERASFDCGVIELNTFIKTQAAKHMQAGINRTMVLPATSILGNGKFPIWSFYSIAPGSIKKDSLPRAIAKKLPHYPIPVFILGQLAVNSTFQKQGLGKITLIKALEQLWKLNFDMSLQRS